MRISPAVLPPQQQQDLPRWGGEIHVPQEPLTPDRVLLGTSNLCSVLKLEGTIPQQQNVSLTNALLKRRKTKSVIPHSPPTPKAMNQVSGSSRQTPGFQTRLDLIIPSEKLER